MNIPVKYLKRFAACCGWMLAFAPCVHAQGQAADAESSDSNTRLLYFRISSATVDSTYMGNRHVLRRMDAVFSDSALVARIDSVNIYSYSSPEGKESYNLRLATRRAAGVKDYLIRNYPRLDADRVHALPQGENWHEMRQMIACDNLVPCREEVLRIIDSNADHPERCKLLLKDLRGGIPYRYIRTRVLPRLRSACVSSVCVVRLKEDGLPGVHTPAGFPTDNTGRKSYPHPGIPPQSATYTVKRPLLALKTNLLFDAALMPNIEAEVPIGNRWSVNGELMFPWWLFDDDKYCLQILSGGLEGRYWLGNRNRRRVLTGHFMGLYAGAGKYDLQWDKNGYQGEFFIAAGVSYGYALPVSRNLRLEFNLGIGLLRTSYEHYHTLDNYRTLLWQDSGRYTWLGPTKVKVSLVWMLNRKMKKGGER